MEKHRIIITRIKYFPGLGSVSSFHTFSSENQVLVCMNEWNQIIKNELDLDNFFAFAIFVALDSESKFSLELRPFSEYNDAMDWIETMQKQENFDHCGLYNTKFIDNITDKTSCMFLT